MDARPPCRQAAVAADARLQGPATMPTDEAGWWERQRAELIRQRMDALAGLSGRMIDVGCGRGTMLDDERFEGQFVVQVDSHIWAEWAARPGNYVCARANALPFRDGSFDVVGSFDVIEHLEDDAASLAEQRRIAHQRGAVLTAVPADPRLWSAHDEAVGHHRRYTTSSLSDVAESAGLRIESSTHFFSFLWLPALLLRRSDARREASAGDGLISSIVGAGINALSALERAVTRRWSLPFGSSLLAVMRDYSEWPDHSLEFSVAPRSARDGGTAPNSSETR